MSKSKEALEKVMDDSAAKGHAALNRQAKWLTWTTVLLVVWIIMLTWSIATDNEVVRVFLPIPAIAVWFCLVGFERARGDFKRENGLLDGIGEALRATRDIILEETEAKPIKKDAKTKK